MIVTTRPAGASSGRRATAARWVTHLRAARSLSAPLTRLVPWWHVVAGTGMGLVLVLGSQQGDVSLTDVVTTLRLVAVALAATAAFVLDDPAAAITAPLPQPRSLRWGIRVLLLAPAFAAGWLALVVVAAAAVDAPAGAGVPVGDLSLEVLGLAVVTIALAAAAERVDLRGGLVAGPGILAVAVVLTRLPDRAALFVPPPRAGEAQAAATWAAAHTRWAWLTVAAIGLVLLVARDPARPPRRAARPVNPEDNP